MSISIGIYDFFSYTVPGLIYLLVAYSTLSLFRPIRIDLSNLRDAVLWGSLILLVLFSFLIGHIFDSISHRVWYRLFYRGGSQERAYDKFNKIVGVKASFNPHQWNILLGAIRHNNAQLAEMIDRNKATSIMLRNISFALFLLGVVFFLKAVTSIRVWHVFALLALIIFICSVISLRRSDNFNMGFYQTIFIQALMYGDSLEKVVEANRVTTGKNVVAYGKEQKSLPPNKTRKVKSERK